jgi:glycosyltransferase involved in cell wall biosynthesis
MNVGLILTGNEGYGVKNVWTNLIMGLSKKGYKITIFLLENSDSISFYRSIGVDNLEFVTPPNLLRKTNYSRNKILAIFRNSIFQLKSFHWMINEIKKKNCDQFIFQNPLYLLICGMLNLFLKITFYWMIPNVISSGYLFDFNRKVYRFIINFAGVKVLPNSKYTESTLGQGKFDSYVVYPGVDVTKFRRTMDLTSFRDTLKIPNDSNLLCVAASLTKIKGHAILIEAMSRINRDKNIQLIFCGGPIDGDEAKDLMCQVEKLGLSEIVHFIGPVSDIAPYFQISDVIVSPSIIAEGFGLSIVEAMASSKPVLAHALGAPSETIIDGVTGWLIQELTVESLIVGIMKTIEDKGKWVDMGIAARKRVENNYSTEIMTDKVCKILDKKDQ